MKVILTDTFTDSLERLIKRERWYWKWWDLVRYGIPRFFRNIWRFRKELWNTYSWDSSYTLKMLKRNLELTADYIEKYGHEVDGPRLKKVAAMRRAIEILTYHTEDTFIELAEKQLGKEYIYQDLEFEPVEGTDSYQLKRDDSIEEHNSDIRELSLKIERETWAELFKILQGQDYSEFRTRQIKAAGTDAEQDWEDWFDGSDIRGWWD